MICLWRPWAPDRWHSNPWYTYWHNRNWQYWMYSIVLMTRWRKTLMVISPPKWSNFQKKLFPSLSLSLFLHIISFLFWVYVDFYFFEKTSEKKRSPDKKKFDKEIRKCPVNRAQGWGVLSPCSQNSHLRREYVHLDSVTRRVYFYESLVGGGLRPWGPSSVVFGYVYVLTNDMHLICTGVYACMYIGHVWNCKVWVGGRRGADSDSDCHESISVRRVRDLRLHWI